MRFNDGLLRAEGKVILLGNDAATGRLGAEATIPSGALLGTVYAIACVRAIVMPRRIESKDCARI